MTATTTKAAVGKRCWLTVSDSPSHKPIFGRWANISDDGLIDGETPIEDYKFWLVTDTEISKEEAWDKWMAALAEVCGDYP